MRPPDSVAGTRCTRCTPDSNFSEDVAAADIGDRLLVAADAGFVHVHHLELPLMRIGVALIHAEEIGREQRRLVAAGAGAHLEDGVLGVGLVLGQEQDLELALEVGDALLQLFELGFGELAHLGVALRIGDQLGQIAHLGLSLAQRLDLLHHRREIGIFLGEPGEFLRVHRRAAGQPVAQFLLARHHLIELGVHAHRTVLICPYSSVMSSFPFGFRSLLLN